MKSLRQSDGFTVAEVVIVLAITALLLTGALAGRGGQRESVRFATTIDGIKGDLSSQQNEAQRSIEQPSGRSDFGKGKVNVFGKLIEFDSASPKTFKSYTLIINENVAGGLNRCDIEVHNLPNGVEYKGSDPSGNGTGAGGVASQDIIFTKVPAQMYVTPPAFNASPIPTVPSCAPANYTNPIVPTSTIAPPAPDNTDILNQSNYDPANAAFTANANLLFQQVAPSTKKALIQIFPGTNTIDRKFFE